MRILRDCDLLKFRKKGQTPREVLDYAFKRSINKVDSKINKIMMGEV
jgi:hypothetical protein